jgi:hypothetical protein
MKNMMEGLENKRVLVILSDQPKHQASVAFVDGVLKEIHEYIFVLEKGNVHFAHNSDPVPFGEYRGLMKSVQSVSALDESQEL